MCQVTTLLLDADVVMDMERQWVNGLRHCDVSLDA